MKTSHTKLVIGKFIHLLIPFNHGGGLIIHRRGGGWLSQAPFPTKGVRVYGYRNKFPQNLNWVESVVLSYKRFGSCSTSSSLIKFKQVLAKKQIKKSHFLSMKIGKYFCARTNLLIITIAKSKYLLWTLLIFA